MQEYAAYLLPHVIQPPFRKGRKRPSGTEVAEFFLRIMPVSHLLDGHAVINVAGHSFVFLEAFNLCDCCVVV